MLIVALSCLLSLSLLARGRTRTVCADGKHKKQSLI